MLNDVYTFSLKQDNGFEVTVKTEERTIYELVEDFKSFLLGCTFSPELVEKIQYIDEPKEKTTSYDSHYGGNCC